MKLIIIHGPPAAGKLTVSEELAARTGFKVFHNHLSIDCVKPVFEFGTPPFGRLVEKIRVETIAEAAREGVDIVHTFVYVKGADDANFERIIAAAEDNGGEVGIVLLAPTIDELKRRVTNERRAEIGKVATLELLESLYEKYDLVSTFPGRDTLAIDNTSLLPSDTAERIIDHYAITPAAAV